MAGGLRQVPIALSVTFNKEQGLAVQDRDLLWRYLLGDLSAAEREALDEELRATRVRAEELSTAENDLIDAYVLGRLAQEQRRKFDSYFLNSSAKRERVEMAEMLMSPAVRKMLPATKIKPIKSGGVLRSLTKQAFASKRFALQFALLAATMVVVAATFLAIENARLRSELSHAGPAHDPKKQAAAFQQEQQAPGAGKSQQGNAGDLKPQESEKAYSRVAVASIFLTPGLLRSAEDSGAAHLLRITPGARSVLLMLSLDSTTSPDGPTARDRVIDKHYFYSVTIQTAEGQELCRVENIASELASHGGQMLTVHVPSRLFPEGDYVINVSRRTPGGEWKEIDSYSFSVRRSL